MTFQNDNLAIVDNIPQKVLKVYTVFYNRKQNETVISKSM